MKLYRLWQNANVDYDTYDSAIVAAPTALRARWTHPADYMKDEEWDGTMKAYDSWCSVEDVQVECIGEAVPHIKEGVIIASFNAG